MRTGYRADPPPIRHSLYLATEHTIDHDAPNLVCSAENQSLLTVILCWEDLVCSAENQSFLIVILNESLLGGPGVPRHTPAVPRQYHGVSGSSGAVFGAPEAKYFPNIAYTGGPPHVYAILGEYCL